MTSFNAMPPGGNPFNDAASRLRQRWGWIVAFGVFCALMGLAALVLTETATIASVLVIGFFMMLAGFVEIGIGLRTRTWGRMLLWEAAGLLYVVAGAAAIALPGVASVFITLALGAGLLATGITRIVLGTRMAGSRSKGMVTVAGVLTAVVGLLIVLGWPGNSILILGTFLGIDLLFYGLTWTLFGLRLKNSA